MKTNFAGPWLSLVTAAVLTCAGMSSCVGYNVYPAEAGDGGFTNVNSDPFPPVLTGALQWAVVRYPPNASTEFSAAAPAGPEVPFALNLPAGMNPLLAERIAKNVGFGAEPLYEGNESLPIYHVSRVWISGDEARVDVIRPVRGLPAAGGKDATQAITIRLRGGVQQWRVTSHRTWSLNSLPVPALNFVAQGRVSTPGGAPAPTDAELPEPEMSELSAPEQAAPEQAAPQDAAPEQQPDA